MNLGQIFAKPQTFKSIFTRLHTCGCKQNNFWTGTYICVCICIVTIIIILFLIKWKTFIKQMCFEKFDRGRQSTFIMGHNILYCQSVCLKWLLAHTMHFIIPTGIRSIQYHLLAQRFGCIKPSRKKETKTIEHFANDKWHVIISPLLRSIKNCHSIILWVSLFSFTTSSVYLIDIKPILWSKWKSNLSNSFINWHWRILKTQSRNESNAYTQTHS